MTRLSETELIGSENIRLLNRVPVHLTKDQAQTLIKMMDDSIQVNKADGEKLAEYLAVKRDIIRQIIHNTPRELGMSLPSGV